MTAIPLVNVEPEPHPGHHEAPYQAFIAASLVLGIGGGFALSLLLPLARTLDWAWGANLRWSELAQIHGQLQLIGFAGLFVMGMSLRIMPRVSGRVVAFQPLVRTLIPLVAGYLLTRSIGQPMGPGGVRDVMLVASALMLLAASAAFAAIVGVTLLHPTSRAEATGYFFVFGAAGFLLSSLINAAQTYDIIRDGLPLAPATRQTALVFTQQFGFLMMFIAGVGSRAIPGLIGRPRGQALPRATAVVYAAAVTGVSAFLLYSAESRPSDAAIRAGDLALGATGVCFLSIIWTSGALYPRSNVARASRLQFWFVRVAFAWLAIAAALIIWHGWFGLSDAAVPDQFALDAIRHTLTLGVLTTLVVGMSLLIVPEFAGRRLQHPREGWLHLSMLAALVGATALRIWPAVEGVDWLEDSRYWPMAASGALASAAIIMFAVMFAQSWYEQRDPLWAAKATGVNRG